jgi:hypothetical protein
VTTYCATCSAPIRFVPVFGVWVDGWYSTGCLPTPPQKRRHPDGAMYGHHHPLPPTPMAP